MFAPLSRLPNLLLVVLAALPISTVQAADDRADAALKALADRSRDVSPRDRDKLLQDLLAFRRTYPGTAQAVEASKLLSRLPSPLDRLDASTIPALERFDWQPKELVAVVGEHRGRQGSVVAAVAYSGDGSVVASAGGSLVRIWDPATLRLRAVGGHPGLTCVAVSRDGKLVAAGGSGGGVTVWDLSAPEKLTLRFNIAAATSPVYGVAISPDSHMVAVACFDNAVRIFDVSGKEAKNAATLTNHEKAVHAVAYSPDGKTLASAGADLTVRLWTLSDRLPEEKATLTGHAKEVAALAFTRDGKTLASADRGGAVRLWTLLPNAKPKERAAFASAGSASAQALSFSANGQSLAVALSDTTVRLWGLAGAQPRERTRCEGHAGSVTGVAWSADGKTVVSGSTDWTVRSWDVTGTRPKDRFPPRSHLSAVYAIAFSPDGHTLASAGEDKGLRLWDLTGNELRTRQPLKGDSVVLHAVAFSADGKHVAAGGQYKYVRQWETATGKGLRPVTGHLGHISTLVYLPDGRLLGLSGKQLLLWDARKSEVIRRFETIETPFNCLAVSADGRQALTGNGTYLYKDGKLVYKDNQPVFTDCLLRLWDLDSGDLLATDKSSAKPIYSTAFSPDGRTAYSGPWESLWRSWDTTDRKLKAATKGELSSWAAQLTVSPDGRTLAVRHPGGTVALVDLSTGKKVKEFGLHEVVHGICWASDSRHLGVALATGVVYVFRLDSVR